MMMQMAQTLNPKPAHPRDLPLIVVTVDGQTVHGYLGRDIITRAKKAVTAASYTEDDVLTQQASDHRDGVSHNSFKTIFSKNTHRPRIDTRILSPAPFLLLLLFATLFLRPCDMLQTGPAF